jgi:hypothetical protein
MGTHVSIQNTDRIGHPEWLDLFTSGSEDFSVWSHDLPKSTYVLKTDEVLTRPTDFDIWRSAIPIDFDNFDQFLNLLYLLEKYPDFWISVRH